MGSPLVRQGANAFLHLLGSLAQQEYSGLPLLGGPAGYVTSLAVNFVKGVSQPMTVTAKNVTNDPNFNQLIRDYLNEPLDPKSLAAQVSSREQALDLYRLSAAAIVADNQAEQNYLNALAAVLGLDGSTKLQLDQESAQLRLQLAQQ